ncbi:MAG: trypsin-like peptidase domain-containing protein [Candidatus Obscuribacterales bacterium]|jgi:S1-C subfamily serine protease|nr:trypsin-like peptidase domain-containing protein [Candidatus Obscuribacterales bacterium]
MKIRYTRAGALLAVISGLLAVPAIAEESREGIVQALPAGTAAQSASAAHASQFLGPNTIPDLVDSVSPAVVNIVSTSPMTRDQATRIREQRNADNARRIRRYFGMDGDPGNQVRTTGAGVIIRSDGFILTSLHVVRGADSVKVTLKDGRSFDASVIGRDTFSDLATIKINATGLQTVKFGNADKLRLGQWVMAIGNPYAYENSVSAGLISGLGREAKAFTQAFGARTGALRFIQTDVPLNPGSSGGPLFNLQGEVVGINSFIRDEAQNIGFAIPSNVARDVGEKLIKQGTVQHPYLGIEMRDPAEMPSGAGLTPGVEVTKVKVPSPASSGGIEVGDIIMSIDTNQIREPSDVSNMVATRSVGEKLQITVKRNGSEKNLLIKIENLPEELE